MELSAIFVSDSSNAKNLKTFIHMIQQNKRKVKLHSKYRPLASNEWPYYKQIPWLNVSGVWLERAGFRAGNQVEIIVTENQLVIKNCSTDADRSY